MTFTGALFADEMRERRLITVNNPSDADICGRDCGFRDRWERFIFSGSGNITVSGNDTETGPQNLVYEGSGTLTLSGTNTRAGAII